MRSDIGQCDRLKEQGMQMSSWVGQRLIIVLVSLLTFVAAGAIAGRYVNVPYIAAPKWTVLVVDSGGSPVAGAKVRRVRQCYLSEPSSTEEDRITGVDGKVEFPEISNESGVWQVATGIIQNLRAGVHASFGRTAFVFVRGVGFEGTDVSEGRLKTWTGQEGAMMSTIVVVPKPVPK